ncbi:carboxypeptidase-like regulatory domain-containing protein [Flagellimonas allohymeniacidonis]|uniref:Carboxypeptidase-like regulatory domain-containing protein n=1 Tax=Flagellimonas allohymeniacidonis TaxID=2517819 RepID=A0A4Q8QFK6_9FLAO|nr:carboxypeptidase-like regulatory domain-containing protein [Allomuricauda hymeniacidonis]TAI48654.1 carboxypeptidase-like regulatory domain-containing protein [Allomuricauda hymeniacidonis]
MVEKILASLLLFGIPLFVSAQKDYKGKIVDAKTGNPVPYVNIGIVDRGIGTVSDEDGIFHLELTQEILNTEEEVLFSSLGYEPLKIPIPNLEYRYNDYPLINLQPSVVELQEVVVSNIDSEFVDQNVGYRNLGENIFGYWKENGALGGELATRIHVKKGLRKLNSLGFEIWSSTSDSVLLRINIYDIEGPFGAPKTNLNTSKKSIIYMVKKGQRFGRVDLNPYSIFVRNDFVASLELLEVYGGEELGLVLAASSYETDSFRKYASQDKWEKLPNSAMAFFLESSFMVPTKTAERINKRQEKKKKKLAMISGFVINRGRMLSDVVIINMRTKEQSKSNENGRYSIHAKEKDVLSFTLNGFETRYYRVSKKSTLNANLQLPPQ